MKMVPYRIHATCKIVRCVKLLMEFNLHATRSSCNIAYNFFRFWNRFLKTSISIENTFFFRKYYEDQDNIIQIYKESCKFEEEGQTPKEPNQKGNKINLAAKLSFVFNLVRLRSLNLNLLKYNLLYLIQFIVLVISLNGFAIHEFKNFKKS